MENPGRCENNMLKGASPDRARPVAVVHLPLDLARVSLFSALIDFAGSFGMLGAARFFAVSVPGFSLVMACLLMG